MKFRFLSLLPGLLVFQLISLTGWAQFAPAAGQPGSTAMHKDSSAFLDWAIDCSVTRGWMDISDTTLGLAWSGQQVDGAAKADGATVSLGDGGEALISFEFPIRNGIGYDFAVFENSFSDDFLELAFVEVSSDGIYFARFPSTSNTDTSIQVGTFGLIDPTHINNLAGKYRAQFGTPFDLAELGTDPMLNLDSIVFVRIVDVVGSIDSAYATRDAGQNKINDPWPTPFENAGFDLDAVGVIHSAGIPTAIHEVQSENEHIRISPNPVASHGSIMIDGLQGAAGEGTLQIIDHLGHVLWQQQVNTFRQEVVLSGVPSGVHSLRFFSDGKSLVQPLVVY